jgi:hypothetical protein
MRTGPPKVIESLIAMLVPPASREHVMGDLHERYSGVRSYLADACSAVPGAIAGQVMRTTDWQVLAMEAGALYFSFLAAGCAALGAQRMCEHGVFLRLLIPVALAMLALVWRDAYVPRARCGASLEAGLGVGCAVALSRANVALPGSILFSGGALGAVLIFSLRKLFPPGGNRPRGEVL